MHQQQKECLLLDHLLLRTIMYFHLEAQVTLRSFLLHRHSISCRSLNSLTEYKQLSAQKGSGHWTTKALQSLTLTGVNTLCRQRKAGRRAEGTATVTEENSLQGREKYVDPRRRVFAEKKKKTKQNLLVLLPMSLF